MDGRRRRLLTLAGAAVMLPQGAGSHEPLVRRRERLFGSPVQLQAVDGPLTELALDEVLGGLRDIDRRWNAWKPGELGALNRALREGHAARVSPAMLRLIDGARRLELRSGGLFNAGIGGLVGAWGFHADELRDGPGPGPAQLALWRASTPSLGQLRLDGRWLRSANPRLQLDFGGYAKGVAVDWALDRLHARGVRGALVDLGGNLATMGLAAGRGWQVGLRDPASPGLIAQIQTGEREAVVTSGIYERWRLAGAELASHIIDPFTGRPANELVSTTVVHPSAALADAAATALLVAGPLRWPTVARRMGVSQVLVVDRRLRATVSASLAVRLTHLAPGWAQRLQLA